MSGPLYIGVCGGGTCTPGEAAVAEECGRRVAEAGATLVCGGLGGVMEAACRGAREAGGTTVGLLPGSSRDEANPSVTVAIPTGLGEARNALVVRAADALIALYGEFGTLSEIALALRTGVPVVGVGSWELSKGGVPADAYPIVGTAEEAVTAAIRAAQAARAR